MTKVAIIYLTELDADERHAMTNLAVAMYTGERCKFCHHEFTSVQDIKERHAVFAGYHEYGRLACKACWDTATEEERHV